MILTHEAGRDSFWLARFLVRRDVEVHVMQSSSLPVDRRAGEDGRDRRRDQHSPQRQQSPSRIPIISESEPDRSGTGPMPKHLNSGS